MSIKLGKVTRVKNLEIWKGVSDINNLVDCGNCNKKHYTNACITVFNKKKEEGEDIMPCSSIYPILIDYLKKENKKFRFSITFKRTR